MAFALSDVVDEGAELGAAPTAGGYGTGSPKCHLLATFALDGDVRWMPLVDLAKRDFAALVVCLDALDDMHHGLLPLPPSLFGRAFLPGSTLVGWGAAPSSGGRQVAVPHSYAAVSWPRNDCTILLYEGDVYAGAGHKVSAEELPRTPYMRTSMRRHCLSRPTWRPQIAAKLNGLLFTL